MNARTQQLIAALTLALACSAVFVSGANADRRPDNRSGIRGIGSQNTNFSNVVTRTAARAHAVQVVRPDDRAGLRGIGGTPVELTDVFDRAVLRHGTSAALRPDDRGGLRGTGTSVAIAAPVAATVSAGFQWADAGFGAAAALALVLILAGIAAVLTNHHRGQAILD
jgi:hypothetical protein